MNEQYFRDEWKDFRRFEMEEHAKILGKLSDVEKKVEDLNKWRWTMTGINMTISFVVATFGVFMASHLLK
jgi:hypothetical protein